MELEPGTKVVLDKENPFVRCEIAPGGKRHEYSTMVYYAKFKNGIYKRNGHLGVASKEQIDMPIVIRSFIDRAEVRKREGRFHDWAFQIKEDK